MSEPKLGRLEALDPKTLWQGSREALIAWLAEADNLDLLDQALGLDMEVEAADRTVGPLTADLICRDLRDDSRVVIEVQFGDTDDGYLGRLIAQSAGLEAGKIVWIATRFLEEHRAALDWLNRYSTSKLSFYAVELQAFRVNRSAPAPRFHLLVSPNDWTRSARRGVRVIETEELSEGRRYQLDYWSSLLVYLRERGGPIHPSGKAAPKSWTAFRIGSPGIRLLATQGRRDQTLRAEIVLSGEEAPVRFARLQQQRDEIEATVGYPLEWTPAVAGRDHRIGITAKGSDIANRADWARQHQWLAERLEELYRAFVGRLRALDEIDEEEDAAA